MFRMRLPAMSMMLPGQRAAAGQAASTGVSRGTLFHGIDLTPIIHLEAVAVLAAPVRLIEAFILALQSLDANTALTTAA